MVEVELETSQLPLQVNRVPKENLVKKFAPWASDQPLHEGMRKWRVRNRFLVRLSQEYEDFPAIDDK